MNNKNFTKKQIKILKKYFTIYDDNEQETFELETWTNGGVDMFITLWKNDNENTLLEQFNMYIDSFEIDEEITLYREDEKYREHFTIRESLEDFEDYINKLKKIYKELTQGEKEDE